MMGRNRGSFTRRSGDTVPTAKGRPLDFFSVYAIGPKEGRPIKIGYCYEPNGRLSGLQVGNWIEMFIHYNVWVADMMLARRIEQACHRILDKAKKRLIGEWFDITPEWAKKVIWYSGREQNIPLYTNRDVNSAMASVDGLKMAELIRMTDVFAELGAGQDAAGAGIVH